MTVYLETKGWHPRLIGGKSAIDSKTVATIRGYWVAGDKPSYIATKCGVSHNAVLRYTEDLPRQKPRKKLTAVEISGLLRGW